ncbi:MAG: hypothetical protein EBZ77_02510, partial [Chitinophagia bacterium]|nr:hypothetical protein [Chitinophagia bacterium]
MKNVLLLLLFLLSSVNAKAWTISITASDTVACTGDTITLKAVPSGVVAPHYQWQQNGRNIGGDTLLLRLSSFSDGDTIQCLLLDAAGIGVIAQSNYYVVHLIYPLHAGTITGPDTICSGVPVVFHDSVAGGRWLTTNGYAYVNGDTIIGNNTVGLGGPVPQACVVLYVLSNKCSDDTATKPVIVDNQPFILASVPESLCLWQSSDLIYLGEYRHFTSISSLYGNVVVIYSSAINAVALGKDVVVLTDSNYCGLDIQRYNITVTPAIPQGSIKISKDVICLGDTLHLSGDSMYLTQQYYSVTPNMTVDYQGLATAVYPGHDTITIFGYTSCGDFRKSTKEVTILGPGPIQIADSILCTGTATQAFDIVPDGRWRLAGSAVAMVDSITGNMVCVQPGIDTLTYRISSNNCSTKKIISVSPLPLPVTGDSLQVQGGKLTLHSTGGYWR